MRKKNIGSTFDSWLRDEGIYEEATANAMRRVSDRQDVIRSSGNVFADMGLPDAAALDAKARQRARRIEARMMAKAIRESLIGAINAQAVKQKGVLETGRILDSWINKPRPLERRDLSTGTIASMFPVNPEDGSVYKVTIKTDGRRVLACWHETGLYLCSLAGVISRIMSWDSEEETPGSDLIGTILDCELIEEGFITEQTNFNLYIFDCMFVRVQ